MTRSILTTGLLLLLIGPAAADDFSECFDDAGVRYSIAPQLLRAIAQVESDFRPDAINRNGNGSLDTGLMQINSFWWPHLAHVGIAPSDLLNPCTSIHVAAWVLAQEVRRFGYTWRAVGAYHAGPADSPEREQRRWRYAHAVFDRLADAGVR